MQPSHRRDGLTTQQAKAIIQRIYRIFSLSSSFAVSPLAQPHTRAERKALPSNPLKGWIKFCSKKVFSYIAYSLPFRLFGSTGFCSACSKTIPAFEMVMRARNNVYHLECFACQQCSHRWGRKDVYHLECFACRQFSHRWGREDVYHLKNFACQQCSYSWVGNNVYYIDYFACQKCSHRWVGDNVFYIDCFAFQQCSHRWMGDNVCHLECFACQLSRHRWVGDNVYHQECFACQQFSHR